MITPPPDDLPEDSLASYGRRPADQTIPTMSVGPIGASVPEEPPTQPEPKLPVYHLRSVIGRGGMGEVWEAVQETLQRVVAVKRIRTDALELRPESERRQSLEFFQREAYISGLLEHPNIVPVHDYGHMPDGSPLLAMKRVHGTPWNKMLQEDMKVLKPADLLVKHLPILVDVAQAVAFAHSRGIVHRDIKPSQVMVGEYGEVLLMDWGLAVSTKPSGDVATLPVEGLSGLDSASSPSGTPALMAPEQTQPTATGIGTWTDIYLLGGTLYYLLTGTYPHAAPTARQAFERASVGIVESPSTRSPGKDIPEGLAAIAMHALEAEPAKRIASASGFVTAIQDFISGASRRRESVSLTTQAASKFGVMDGTNPPSGAAAFAVFGEVGETVAQALQLWPENAEALNLRARNLTAQASAEISQGDLIVAGLHLRELERTRAADGSAVDKLRVQLTNAEQRRDAARRQRLVLAGVAAILLIAALMAAFVAVRQGEGRRLAVAQVAEQSRLKRLFERANSLRSAELDLAAEMEKELPLPKDFQKPKANEVSYQTTVVAGLMARRKSLTSERRELAEAGIPLDPEPYSLLLADANLRLHDARNAVDALAAYELYAKANRARPELPEPMTGMGIAAYRADNSTSATTLLDQATTLTLELRGKDSREYAEALSLAGESFQRLGDTEESYRGYYKRSAQVLEPQWLDLSMDIGTLYIRLGDPAQSLAFTTPTLTIAQRRWGRYTGSYHRLLAQVATTYLNFDDYDSGRKYAEEDVEVIRGMGLENDIAMAVALNNLAGLYLNLGEYEKALPMIEDSLRIKRLKQAADDPSTLNTESMLAGAYFTAGRYPEAEASYRSVVEKLRKRNGEKHPRTLQATSALAVALAANGKSAEAVDYSRIAMDGFIEVFGPEHPASARSMSELAGFIEAQGAPYPKELEGLYSGAIAILRKENPSREWSRAAVDYSIYLRKSGRPGEAEELALEAQRIGELIFKGDNPAMPPVLEALAEAQLMDGKPEMALATSRESVAMGERIFPAGHPYRVQTNVDHAVILRGVASKMGTGQWPERALLLFEVVKVVEANIDFPSAPVRIFAADGTEAALLLGDLDSARIFARRMDPCDARQSELRYLLRANNLAPDNWEE